MTAAPNSSPDELSLRVFHCSQWPEIFRSWFWRFYDHLFKLLLYNLAWSLSCCGIAWIAIHFGWVEIPKDISLTGPLQLYVLFLVENGVSVGWAYLIFKIFIEGHGSLREVWVGTRKYFWKATGLSAVSGLLFFLVLYNIHFYFSLVTTNRFLTLLVAAFAIWILVFCLAAFLHQWPILFFQNPPFLKVLKKSLLLTLGNGLVSLGIVLFFAACFVFFLFVPFLMFFIGAVFFFSFQCVALEKSFLKYKITYGDEPLQSVLEHLEVEQQRGWRELLKPWENR